MPLLRRSSSFKRAVGRRASESTESALNVGDDSVILSGSVSRLGKKSSRGEPCFAVLYSDLVLALHKSAKDFSPFRAFPYEAWLLDNPTVTVVETATPEGPVRCLSLANSGGGESHLLLSFGSDAQLESWRSAFDMRAKAYDSGAGYGSAPATVGSAEPPLPAAPTTVRPRAILELEEECRRIREETRALHESSERAKHEALRLNALADATHAEMEALIYDFPM